jgi:hypothetical protein
VRFAALSLIALTGLAQAAPRDEQPPVLAEVKGARARIVVRGELSPARGKQLVSLVTTVVSDVERRFLARHDADPTVTLLLFDDAATYREAALTLRDPLVSELGFYLPDRRIAIANIGNSVGNLRHELVHPLLGDDFPGIPAWLNEGIAALYGSSTPTKRGMQFLVNYRLRDLQRALKAGTLPTVEQLARSTEAELYGKQAMVYYALARYVLLYVDRQGTLGQLYAELRAAKRSEHAAVLAKYVNEDSFRVWARKLRF